MSQTKKLEAQVREQVGKGAARAVRLQGLTPAVIYGDKKEPVSISLDTKSLTKLVYAGGFKTTVFDITVNGKSEHVVPRDVQFHPVKDTVRHVDFLRVGKNATITVDVPVHFTNEDKCPGIKAGGVLNVVEHALPLYVNANDIPEFVTVDLAKLNVGDSIHISNVNLPKGVRPVQDTELTIATIVPPKVSAADAATDAEKE